MTRPAWDFGYAPVGRRTMGGEQPCDLVLATEHPVSIENVTTALSGVLPDLQSTVLCDRKPIFWIRLRSARHVEPSSIEAHLRLAGIPVRYVASSILGSQALPPPLRWNDVPKARPTDWRARKATRFPDSEADGCWFLRDGEGGVAVDRERFGGGAGTRLAVIDDDAGLTEKLELDALVLIQVESATHAHSHGAQMVAWAVGCGQREGAFRGVAPDASPRFYLVPRAGTDVVSVPLAIVQAVDAGADVVACATYLEGSTSPMLDDALEFASQVGRAGRGTAIVLPTGREASSPEGSVHASWSLDLGDPASDPRVFCIAPSARGEGWFHWLDRRKRYRPFANRGPAVRWMAPGDDIAFPFSERDRPFHAESSGASAVAAGVVLLVIAANPTLRIHEIDAILTDTAERVSPVHRPDLQPLADPSDRFPEGLDPDGHNAKHGYGRLHAGRACLVASDPVAAALVAIGEDAAARRWLTLRHTDEAVRSAYTSRLARSLARRMLTDRTIAHSIRVLARHARLVGGDPRRHVAHADGAWVRQLAVLLRRFSRAQDARAEARRLACELDALAHAALVVTQPGAANARATNDALFSIATETLPRIATTEVLFASKEASVSVEFAANLTHLGDSADSIRCATRHPSDGSSTSSRH